MSSRSLSRPVGTAAPTAAGAAPTSSAAAAASPLVSNARRQRPRFWWVRTISPLVWVCMGIMLVFVTCGVFAEVIAPHDPTTNNLRARLTPPAFVTGGSTTHLLGTDQLGRDLLTRVIYGARVSLLIGFTGMLLGAAVGALSGLTAGFRRGVVDELLMFLVDAWSAVPFIIVALAFVAVLGTHLWVLVLLAALSGWATYTRVTRGLALSGREQQYVVAAQSIGATPRRVLLRHILPNIVSPMIVLATLELTSIILLEASLSFLGFGVQPPTPAWGYMVSEGREYLHTHWWLGIFPGVAIMLITISISLIGDWLRDLLDPTLRTR